MLSRPRIAGPTDRRRSAGSAESQILSNKRSYSRAGIALAAILLALSAPGLAAQTPSPAPMTWAQIQAQIKAINARTAAAQHNTDVARAKADAAKQKKCAHDAEMGAAPNYDADTGCDAISVKVAPH